MSQLSENDLRKYKMFGLSLLQFMSLLAVVGIILAVIIAKCGM